MPRSASTKLDLNCNPKMPNISWSTYGRRKIPGKQAYVSVWFQQTRSFTFAMKVVERGTCLLSAQEQEDANTLNPTKKSSASLLLQFSGWPPTADARFMNASRRNWRKPIAT